MLKMKTYDISMEIAEDMAVYKNKKEKKPRIVITRTLEQGANESRLEIESHTGTHADAYFHILKDGETIEKINPEKFIGDCTVLDFSDAKNKVTMQDFANTLSNNNNNNNSNKKIKNIKIKKNDIVLLKTRNNPMKNFDFNFAYLDKSGADFLAAKKIKCVGIDNLGIERNQPEHDTHKILLKNNIPIIEGLDLSKIKQGRYFFVGLPLKIKNGDGSPVRAVLLDKG